MKLTLTHYNKTVSIEVDNDDSDLTEMCSLIEQLLKGAGFNFDGHLEIVDGNND